LNASGGYIYVLYGEDGFGRDEALQQLKDRMRALPAGEHNMTDLAGAEATVSNLRLAADVVPFLAERRLIIVRGLLGRLAGRARACRGGRAGGRKSGAGDASAADELQALLEYLPLVPGTTSLAFVEEGRLHPELLVEAIPRGRAIVREFPRVQDLADWIRRRARLLEIDLDEGAVRELAALGGSDLRRLDNELRKLDAYVAGGTISRSDVRELVVGREVAVWSLLDALADRRTDAALRALRALYAQGESPEALLGRDIAPQYRRLLVARELAAVSREERARIDPGALGLNPATVGKWMDQARAFEPAELERALELLLGLDRLIKTGETTSEPALEVAVIQLCTRLGA